MSDSEVNIQNKDKIEKSINSILVTLKKSHNQEILSNYQSIFSKVTQIEKHMEKVVSFFGIITINEKDSHDSIKQRKSLLTILMFNLYFDIYMRLIDLLIFVLVLDGHDLFSYERNKYVKSINDVGRVSVESKFKFLKTHNYDLLIRYNDQRLRNKIAHTDYEIIEEKQCVILSDGKKYYIKNQAQELLAFIILLMEQLYPEEEK